MSKAILVVSFGTSFNDSRALDIKGIEDALAAAFPDWSVRRAFTAQIIINHVNARDGEKIDNVQQALERAVGQIGAEPAASGRYTAVIEAEMASKLVSPVLRALGGYAIQQHNSFLMDSLGKQVFPEGLTILDVPRIPGQTCSKYFDSEGVATRECPIIEKGRVCRYFINTYMAGKMAMAPTVESSTKVKMMPWPQSGPEQARDRAALLRRCRSGILVTDFNGGNCNPATGDFSYGIEGFLFEDGVTVRPVDGMLITGNMKTLWQQFFAAADDARLCLSKLIPTLAFNSVDFSGE